MKDELITQLYADINVGWNAQDWLVRARQARIAKATQILEKKHIEGVGELQMRIDPYVFHTWGKKHGYAIWNDPEFRRQMMRDNPEVRVARPKKGNKVGFGD
jgi:hypothetical protein